VRGLADSAQGQETAQYRYRRHPIFTDTRIPVHILFDYLKAWYPIDDFVDDFLSVTTRLSIIKITHVSSLRKLVYCTASSTARCAHITHGESACRQTHLPRCCKAFAALERFVARRPSHHA
jgi:hypothetical protein